MSTKQYPGRTALETYLTGTEPSSVSYLGFLTSNRSTLVKTPPLTDDWKGLNGAWYRRFLKTSTRLKLPQMVSVAEEDTRSYWEEVINERKKNRVKGTIRSKTIVIYQAIGENVGDEIVDECQQSKRLGKDEIVDRETSEDNYNGRKRSMEKDKEEKGSKRRNMKDTGHVTTIKVYEDDESSGESSDESSDEFESPIEADLQKFDEAYLAMDSERMWTLRSSGRKVEQVIYEFARNLHEESYLHSFIINNTDVTTKKLFSQEEWKEITSSEIKLKPKLEQPQLELLKKYSLDNIKSLRKVLYEPFVPEYDRSIHFDLNFINFAYRAMLFLWEKEENLFVDSQLEGWYEMNVWSNLIDPLFHNLEIQLLRGEGMSLASSDRKNHKRSIDERKKVRKKIGKKGDGVFRLLKKRLEFGAVEAGCKWEGKCGDKYSTDSLKLCKMLRDMIIQLSIEVDMIEDFVRQLQVVGILNGANRIQVIRMDLPKGYVCRVQREKVYEVAGRLTKSQPLAFVLKEMLRAKYTIIKTLNVISKKEEADLENLFNDSEQDIISCSPPKTITILKTFDTPNNKAY